MGDVVSLGFPLLRVLPKLCTHKKDYVVDTYEKLQKLIKTETLLTTIHGIIQHSILKVDRP